MQWPHKLGGEVEMSSSETDLAMLQDWRRNFTLYCKIRTRRLRESRLLAVHGCLEYAAKVRPVLKVLLRFYDHSSCDEGGQAQVFFPILCTGENSTELFEK